MIKLRSGSRRPVLGHLPLPLAPRYHPPERATKWPPDGSALGVEGLAQQMGETNLLALGQGAAPTQ